MTQHRRRVQRWARVAAIRARILQVAIKRGKAAPTDSSGTASASLFLVPIPPKFQPGTESQRRWPEVGIADITTDLPEERFWTAGEVPEHSGR